MVPNPHDLEDLDTTLEDHAVDSVSYGLEYIPWTEISHKPVKPGVAKKLPADPRNISFLKKWK